MKEALQKQARWALFIVVVFFPGLAMAQTVAAPFAPAIGLLRSFITFGQVAGGLWLVKDGYDVARATTQGNPHAKEMQENWAKGAVWVFAGGAIVEWIKRAYLTSGSSSL